MMTKSKFMQDCFSELLSDGKPHPVQEIRAYMIEKAKGTEFEGTLEYENVVNRIKPLIKEHSSYGRVKHGVYQIQQPQRWTEIPTRTQTPVSTPAVVATGFAMIEKRIAELQREMKDTFMICFLSNKDKANAVEYIYNRACEILALTDDEISRWKYAYEHPETLGLQENQESPAEDDFPTEDQTDEDYAPDTEDEDIDESLSEQDGMTFGGM